MNETVSGPITITEKDFAEQVLQSDTPVLVDFWAEWCGPCRALGPVIESLSEDFDGRVRVAKVDIDANQQIAMQLGIRSIPTVILFDKGELVESFVGVRPKAEYAAVLDKVTD